MISQACNCANYLSPSVHKHALYITNKEGLPSIMQHCLNDCECYYYIHGWGIQYFARTNSA